jgi:hypothetical protein
VRLRRARSPRARPTTPAVLAPPLATELGLRVVFMDDDARSRLGTGVVDIDPASLLRKRRARKHIPFVDAVVGNDASLSGRHGQNVIDAAEPSHVIRLTSVPADEQRADDATRPLLSVSPRRFNPIGFKRYPSAKVLLARLEPGAEAPPELARLLDRDSTLPLDQLPDILAAPSHPENEPSIYDSWGLVDSPTLHTDAMAQAVWLVRFAALGLPVIAELSDEARSLLGPDLALRFTTATAADLADPWRRERASVDQRTAALRERGSPAVWRKLAAGREIPLVAPPAVSVLLASNRAEDVLHAAARYAAFGYPNRELVVGLHGSDFPADTQARLRAAVDGPVSVRRFETDRTLGQILNELTSIASGQIVCKMDDDDLYSTTHLDDLLNALRYSEATLVGKGSEFVYLEEIDTTIRRLPSGAESSSRSMGGGTLMMARGDLLAIGGWQRAPRAVDQRLMDDVIAAGGRVHRTHGYGFILMRRSDGHTWSTDVDYFLRQAVRQWPGLAMLEAGIE